MRSRKSASANSLRPRRSLSPTTQRCRKIYVPRFARPRLGVRGGVGAADILDGPHRPRLDRGAAHGTPRRHSRDGNGLSPIVRLSALLLVLLASGHSGAGPVRLRCPPPRRPPTSAPSRKRRTWWTPVMGPSHVGISLIMHPYSQRYKNFMGCSYLAAREPLHGAVRRRRVHEHCDQFGCLPACLPAYGYEREARHRRLQPLSAICVRGRASRRSCCSATAPAHR